MKAFSIKKYTRARALMIIGAALACADVACWGQTAEDLPIAPAYNSSAYAAIVPVHYGAYVPIAKPAENAEEAELALEEGVEIAEAVQDAAEAEIAEAVIEDVEAAVEAAEVAEVVAEEEEIVDPLTKLQRQLESLEKTTAKLQDDFEAEKKKNAKKDKFNLPFNTKVGGQLRMDGAFITADDDAKTNFGDPNNVLGFREFRLALNGSSYGNLQYSACFSVNNTIRMNDLWLRFKDTKYFGDITVGHYFVESGMEAVQTNWDRVFATIDETSTMYRLGRRFGVSSVYYGADKRSRAFFGVFSGTNISNVPHCAYSDDPGIVLNTRLTAAPILREDDEGQTHEVFHIGGSYYWISPAKDSNLSLSTSGMGWQGSAPKFISGSIPLNNRSYSNAAFEAQYQLEGFAISTEGFLFSVDDGGNAYGATTALRWMLTPGVTRRYEKGGGRFGNVKMPDDTIFLDVKNRVIGGNMGALEAVAKWEWSETNNLKDVAGATYGTVNRAVAGANWFWNEQVFWTLNWEHAFVNAKQSGSDKKGEFDTIIVQGSLKF